ncbi:MAG: DASH family cryptochrome [Balneolia bacterium]|nr:DASH family cryptochrome [Balneolia bacterium]
MTSLLWFCNDIRLHDNEALHIATEEAEKLLPVYIFDPRQFAKTDEIGFPKTGPFRLRFLIDSLRDLKSNLQSKGSDLIILTGKPEELIPELCRKHDIGLVSYHEEATHEETQVEDALDDALEKIGVDVDSAWGATLYHLDDLPMEVEKLPDVFTAFRKKAEKYSEVRELFDTPAKLPPLPESHPESEGFPDSDFFGLEPDSPSEHSVLPFAGGETAALKRLETYFWDQDLLKTYKETRNGMLGADYSSKFSAWLANGTISPRYIYFQVKRYEKERKKNNSTYWLIFELIWRDYFRFIALKHGRNLFYSTGIKGKKYEWSTDNDAFRKWANAETGIPMIDANMRELNDSGFMSNRGRQNVASFLAKCLNIDWRWGAEYFESLLVDYDVCSNWGNWAYNSGVGNDPRDRYFNIVGQGKRYDANGDYIRHWLPELKDVPGEYIHEPHKMSVEQQRKAGIEIGNDYPFPMINLEQAYREIEKRGD